MGAEGAQYLANALQVNTVRLHFSTSRTRLNHLHLAQTLTTLHLEDNNIGAEGAQHLANALQVNTVRLHFSTSDQFSTIFMSHSHSQHLILIGTTLALKEHSIWLMHCK